MDVKGADEELPNTSVGDVVGVAVGVTTTEFVRLSDVVGGTEWEETGLGAAPLDETGLGAGLGCNTDVLGCNTELIGCNTDVGSGGTDVGATLRDELGDDVGRKGFDVGVVIGVKLDDEAGCTGTGTELRDVGDCNDTDVGDCSDTEVGDELRGAGDCDD